MPALKRLSIVRFPPFPFVTVPFPFNPNPFPSIPISLKTAFLQFRVPDIPPSTTNIILPAPSLQVTRGKPKSYATTQDSGMTLHYHFCGVCGTTLYKTADAAAFEGVVILQAGSVDSFPNSEDRNGKDGEGKEMMKEPDVELWTLKRVAWLAPLAGTAQMRTFEA
jgi:hypothetical protein